MALFKSGNKVLTAVHSINVRIHFELEIHACSLLIRVTSCMLTTPVPQPAYPPIVCSQSHDDQLPGNSVEYIADL